ncbi:hypothetical protein BU16DRAFT_562052 [Lophium mytilinum]|uniref:Uncharacterized protein n=1 Tax=Lophium mytilinum TaxID=390894 RepID=A0A6A6QQG1_9PEZI|nr:hypothetical protein BU16DRAFT_562052 [Lophium mytilinum]
MERERTNKEPASSCSSKVRQRDFEAHSYREEQASANILITTSSTDLLLHMASCVQVEALGGAEAYGEAVSTKKQPVIAGGTVHAGDLKRAYVSVGVPWAGGVQGRWLAAGWWEASERKGLKGRRRGVGCEVSFGLPCPSIIPLPFHHLLQSTRKERFSLILDQTV